MINPESLVFEKIDRPNADSVYLDYQGRSIASGFYDLGAMYAVGDSLVYILDYDENRTLERVRMRTLRYRMNQEGRPGPTCGRPNPLLD